MKTKDDTMKVQMIRLISAALSGNVFNQSSWKQNWYHSLAEGPPIGANVIPCPDPPMSFL